MVAESRESQVVSEYDFSLKCVSSGQARGSIRVALNLKNQPMMFYFFCRHCVESDTVFCVRYV